MSRTILACALAAFAVATTDVAHGQDRSYADSPIEVNAHVGGLAVDGSDTEVMYGVRAAYHTARGLGFGGSFDLVPIEETEARFGTLGFEGDLTLASGNVSYTFPSDTPVHVFVTLGVGAATFSPDEGDGESELLIPLGGGFTWFLEAWPLAVRGDVRDHIIRVEDGESDTFHNWEFSGGISVLFGP